MEFIRDVILFFVTKGWQKLADENSHSEPSETSPTYILATGRLSEKFETPWK